MKKASFILPPLLLFLLAFAVFAPSVRYGLVEIDDGAYIAGNPLVSATSAWNVLPGCFSSFHEAMYAPLLWCSYALDGFLFRASPFAPWGFHLVNVLLHATNAALFFLLLLRLCHRRTVAFFCAAFWAIHPLRVESVAWIAERKDVLSAFFAFLSLFAWLWFLRTEGRPASVRVFRYLLALALFAAALLVKSSVSPFPGLLVVLDFWPLRRIPRHPAFRDVLHLAAEKLPFFALGIVASALAAAAHADFGVLRDVPLPLRLASVPVDTAFYLLKTILPFRLSPLYLDLPLSPPVIVASLSLLAGLAVVAVRLRRRCPVLAFGILVFALFLFPVSGIVRFGVQSIADRFTYLPALGLSVVLLAAFPGNGVLAGRSPPSSGTMPHTAPDGIPRPKCGSANLGITAASVVLAILSVLTLRLLPVWHDPDSFSDRVLLCNPRQPRMLVAKAKRLFAAGSPSEALPLASTACTVPDPYAFIEAHLLLAGIFQELDRPGEALSVLESIPRNAIHPARLALVDWELARASLALGEPEQALAFAERALASLPSGMDGQRPFLHLLAMAAAHLANRPEEALAHARAFPPYARKTALADIDLLPFHLHEWKEQHRVASAPFFRSLLLSSTAPSLSNNILWGLATSGRSPISPSEILDAATHLAADIPDNPGILDTLAAAQARAGHFEEAQVTLRRAIALLSGTAPSPARDRFEDRLVARLDLYGRHLPCSEEGFALWFAALCGETANPNPAP
jgi:tetratricopeptide (TPR) repeat protein